MTPDEALDILRKEAKKRRESIEELTRAGRSADSESYELGVIESFLPQQLTEDEIRALAQQAIAESGAAGPKEMGKVMGLLNPQTRNRADGKLVSNIVRELLSQLS